LKLHYKSDAHLLLIASSTDSPIFSPSHGTNKLVSWLLLMMDRIAENFCEFRGFVAICQSFLREIWRRGVLWHGTSEQSAKVFSAKIIFFTNSQKFSPSKVSGYTV